MSEPIRYNPDGTHYRRCKCDACLERIRLAQWRKSVPNDGSVCIKTTRCKCPECRAKAKLFLQEYGQKNKAELRKKADVRNEGRRDEIAEYQKKYRQDHKEEMAEWSKQHREKNREAISTQRKAFRQQNQERLNAAMKEYYQTHREERLSYAKQFRDEKMHPEYKIWDSMKQRCDNPNSSNYQNYGGRGIRYDLKWKTFEGFIEDMGPRPTAEYSIERINVNGNYCKENCKWIPLSEQAKNKRRSMENRLAVPDDSLMYVNGELRTLKEFAEYHGIPLLIAKFRYCYHANEDWILQSDVDGRRYEYNGHMYNMTELAALSGIPYDTLYHRIRRLNKSVEEAFEM